MAVIRTSNVDLHVNGNGAYAYVAQPDDDQKHPGVVLVQEWWGIEPHIIDLAQKLAADGFVVAVPDLYNSKVATEPNDAMRIMMLVRDNVDLAVNKVIGALETVRNSPTVEPKKVGLIGFCMGGMLTYLAASRYDHLGAAIPFYGGGYDPTPAEVAKVQAPVLAFYGTQDDSIPAEQRQKIAKLYKDAGKDFTLKEYNAGHAFINPEHGMGNAEAAADAWPRAISFLRDHLR
jgi:carboxymethylenebutenolidase